jgi:hypothetical protein
LRLGSCSLHKDSPGICNDSIAKSAITKHYFDVLLLYGFDVRQRPPLTCPPICCPAYSSPESLMACCREWIAICSPIGCPA